MTTATELSDLALSILPIPVVGERAARRHYTRQELRDNPLANYNSDELETEVSFNVRTLRMTVYSAVVLAVGAYMLFY